MPLRRMVLAVMTARDWLTVAEIEDAVTARSTRRVESGIRETVHALASEGRLLRRGDTRGDTFRGL